MPPAHVHPRRTPLAGQLKPLPRISANPIIRKGARSDDSAGGQAKMLLAAQDQRHRHRATTVPWVAAR
jgi:hypothetical protein